MSAAHEPGGPGHESFDALPFPARMRALSAYGRRLSDAEYQSVRARLDSGDSHQRHLGLHLAVVRRDLAAVERAVADPALRRRALSAAIRLPVSDEVLTALVRGGARRDRLAVYGVLRRSRRRALADRLVGEVHEQYGSRELADLLPACSPDVVARWLSTAGPGAGQLHRLARVAPAAVAEFVLAEAADKHGRELARWLRRHRGLLAVLATRRPRALAEVLRGQPRIAHNLAWDPQVAAALFADPAALVEADPSWLRSLGHRGLPLNARSRAAIAALPADRAASLLRSLRAGPACESVLSAVPLEHRRQVVELAYPADRLLTDLSAEELAVLPSADRAELAHRILAENDTDRNWRRLAITAALPYDQAAPALLEATASHRYQERRAAWTALLSCAVREHDPEALVAALRAARRAWHDQDLVRAAALRPVAAAPARLLSAVPVAVLREAVQAATGAPDMTADTAALISRWLTRSLTSALARGNPDRANDLQALLVRLHADLRTPGRGPSVPGLPASGLWDGLRDRVLRDARRGRFAPALRAGELLASALPPELDRLIGEIARTAEDPADAAAAAKVWTAAPATRDERVGELVAHNPELGRVDALWQVVATRRTDLLDRLLDSGEALPSLPAGRTGRWTPEQRVAVEAHAAAVARDEENPPRERESAVRLITEPGTLAAIADDAPPPVAIAALSRLATTAPDHALPVLQRHANAPAGPVVRGAVRSLGVALDALPASATVGALGPVIARASVGAAKEAARLLAERHPVGAVDVLADVWADPALHHDVRAAAAAALLGFLDEDPRVPGMLGEAVLGEPAVRSAVFRAAPGRLTPGQRPGFARVLADALGQAATAPSYDLVNAYAEWWHHAPGAIDQLPRLATTPASQDAFPVVCRLLLQRPTALATAADQLVLDITTGEPDTADIAWHRLAELASAGAHTGRADGDEISTDASRILIEACRTAGMHAAGAQLLWNLAERSLAGPVDLAIWDELVDAVDERPNRWPGPSSYRMSALDPDPDTAAAVTDHLRQQDGSVPGLLAVQLVTTTARRTGWTPAWSDRLTALRDHPDADVREAARTVRRPRAAAPRA
ncbi:hypothetical protein ABT337_05110 [Saccharopolyspora hirsuta]|uniref:hypothetical protein n=1 Tax=Saccharopolyspora hirsuta TaxID=1837 RepID=UPI00332EA54E